MKTKRFLFSALLATALIVTCEVISAQSSLNTKTVYPRTNLEQVLGIKLHKLVSWETKMRKNLVDKNSSNASVIDLSSLEKDARFYPSNEDSDIAAQPEISMDDIMNDLYKDTKFNPSDYLEKR
jgi:hypothetical protein